MPRFLMLLTAAALTIAGQSALAQQRPDDPPPVCRQQDRKCPPLARQGQRDDRPAPPARHRTDDRRHQARRDAPRPHVGEKARAGRPWTPPRDSRMARAPRGQEYRVIGDHLVLVDQKSQRILSVLAPVRAR